MKTVEYDPSKKKLAPTHSSSHPVILNQTAGGSTFYGLTSPKPRHINHILNDVDKRLFAGTVKAYDVFKKFDVDKDGKKKKNQ